MPNAKGGRGSLVCDMDVSQAAGNEEQHEDPIALKKNAALIHLDLSQLSFSHSLQAQGHDRYEKAFPNPMSHPIAQLSHQPSHPDSQHPRFPKFIGLRVVSNYPALIVARNSHDPAVRHFP